MVYFKFELHLCIFLASINVSSLNWIRAAVFVVCLDRNRLLQPSELASSKDEEEEPLFIDELESAGLQILHGFGSAHFGLNRWFDATIQVFCLFTGSGQCLVFLPKLLKLNKT